MSAANVGTKRRWLISAAAAGVILAATFPLFRAPEPNTWRPAAKQASPVRLSPTRSDELTMRDLAPLFLPTPFNAAPAGLPQADPGRVFFEADPGKLKFNDNNPVLHLPVLVRPPATTVAALSDPPGPLAAGIGQTDLLDQRRNIAHGVNIEAFAGDTGQRVMSVTLDPAVSAKAAGRSAAGWRPMEFLASVDAAGLVGPLLLTSGSGVEEVDNFFRNYLVQTFDLGDRLAPGFYRIVVGP